MKQKNITLAEFLSFFPEVNLPLTLTEESSLTFSAQNKPLPFEALATFILPQEDEHDDLTEYVPCFQVKDTPGIHAVVYWKAGLLNYEYKLLTLDSEGKYIDHKVIAGTISNGESIVRTVSTFDEDWIIHSVVGQEKIDTKTIDTSSEAFSLELLATGEIIFSLNEKL